MAARPVSRSLGLWSSHAFSKSATRASARHFPAAALARPSAQPQTRALTCSAPARNSDPSKDADEDLKTHESPAETSAPDGTGEAQDQPWYLQVEPPSQPTAREPAPLPAIPPEAPAILEPVLKYVYEEMGLDDLDLLDLRDFDPPPALGPNLIMLFGTARSERHLHVASGRLVRWLRYNYKMEADADGLIGPGEMKTKLRRLRRKAKLLGSDASSTRDADNGLSTGWICVNLGTVGGKTSEVARFDSSGQISGFGNAVPETGSTVIVQVMTESRRAELNLESLWRDSLARNQRQRATFSSAPPRKSRPMHASPTGGFASPRSQPLGGHRQKRSYTTDHMTSRPTAAADEFLSPLYSIQRKILELRSTTPGLSGELDSLLSEIFSAKGGESHASDQIALADNLVRTVLQQTPDAPAQDVLISLIGSIARSGSKSPILARAQANLETLMTVNQFPCLPEADLTRLMEAYSAQGNWDRFWEIWRQPPRFGRPRSGDLYATVFELAAATGDVGVCMETLRSCVPGMQFEDPPVFPVDRIYNAVLECLDVADPGAVHMANKVEAGEAVYHYASHSSNTDTSKSGEADPRKVIFELQRDREFVQMVHDLRFARQQMQAAVGSPHDGRGEA